MAMTEERALEILHELIKKPDSKAEDVPRVWSEILGVHKQVFITPEAPAKKKRRRRSVSGGNPSLTGWPKGLTRAAYKAWKESLPPNYEGPVNPQACILKQDGQVSARPQAKAPAIKTDSTKATDSRSGTKRTGVPKA